MYISTHWATVPGNWVCYSYSRKTITIFELFDLTSSNLMDRIGQRNLYVNSLYSKPSPIHQEAILL